MQVQCELLEEYGIALNGIIVSNDTERSRAGIAPNRTYLGSKQPAIPLCSFVQGMTYCGLVLKRIAN